jgi:hypothetical protein
MTDSLDQRPDTWDKISSRFEGRPGCRLEPDKGRDGGESGDQQVSEFVPQHPPIPLWEGRSEDAGDPLPALDGFPQDVEEAARLAAGAFDTPVTATQTGCRRTPMSGADGRRAGIAAHGRPGCRARPPAPDGPGCRVTAPAQAPPDPAALQTRKAAPRDPGSGTPTAPPALRRPHRARVAEILVTEPGRTAARRRRRAGGRPQHRGPRWPGHPAGVGGPAAGARRRVRRARELANLEHQRPRRTGAGSAAWRRSARARRRAPHRSGGRGGGGDGRRWAGGQPGGGRSSRSGPRGSAPCPGVGDPRFLLAAIRRDGRDRRLLGLQGLARRAAPTMSRRTCERAWATAESRRGTRNGRG